MELDYIIDYYVNILNRTFVRGLGYTKKGEPGKPKEPVAHKQRDLDLESRMITEFEEYTVAGQFYVADDGSVVAYNGKTFSSLTEDYFKVCIRAAMKRLGVAGVYVRGSYKKIAEECWLALYESPLSKFVPDKRYIVFNNGVLDTMTGELYKHSDKYKTLVAVDCDFNINATHGRWTTFLQQCLPDEGVRTVLQEFCGALLVDRKKYKIECVAFLLGEGLNGKSVFMDAIKNVFSAGSVTAFSPEDLFKSGTAMYNISAVNGAIANICDDVSKSDISGGEFKKFVSGADFPARDPYGKPYTATAIPLMMCGANRLPVTSDESRGHHRRNLPIPFIRTISKDEVDPELTSKLSSEDAKSAIFTWMYKGMQRLIAQKGSFTECEVVEDVKKELKFESDSVLRWIAEEGYEPVSVEDATSNNWRPMRELYVEYVQHCQDSGDKPKNITRVGTQLTGEGYGLRRMSTGMQRALRRQTTSALISAKFTQQEKEDRMLEELPF